MSCSLSSSDITEGNYFEDLFTQKCSKLPNSLIPTLLMALSAFKTSMTNQMSTKCSYYKLKSNFHPYAFNEPNAKQILL